MHHKISPEAGFLHIRSTGKFSLVEAKRAFIEMLEAVGQHKIGKVLLDGRELAGNPRFMERFYYGEFAAQTVLSFASRNGFPATQFAYVIVIPIRDPGRFGETVAANRGMNMKVFENPDDAFKGLGIAPASKPDAGGGK
jgi:hypothetical protein